MHRERIERAERARLERVQALEQELLTKQRRAEQLRKERLLQRKGSTSKFSRRQLDPNIENTRETSTRSIPEIAPNSSLPEYWRSEKHCSKLTSQEAEYSKAGQVCHNFGFIPQSEPTLSSSKRLVYAPSRTVVPRSAGSLTLSSSSRSDESIRRSIASSRLSNGHQRALSNAISASRSCQGDSNECETPHEDIWTGRGLVVDEKELRKVSILDSTPRSNKSSSSGSLDQDLIGPKATTSDLTHLATGESLSHTPVPHNAVPMVNPPFTSPKLVTVNESHPLLGHRTTPQINTRSAQASQLRRSFRNHPALNNTALYTPVCNAITPARMFSPTSAYMAPRRKGTVGRAAIMLGISTGTASFVENVAKKYEDDINSLVPIPPRVSHLFSYSTSIYTTPVALAVKTSSAELVKAFIDAHADIYTIDTEGRTLLHQLFLPVPSDLGYSSTPIMANAPFRIPEPSDSCYPVSTSPITSALQTPRINETEFMLIRRVKPSKCRIMEAAQPMWASNMDNKANIVELLACSSVSPTIRDSSGRYASDYAKEWLMQAHLELSDANISSADKISACCVRAACLALLTIEDYLRLSYLAPLTTSYKMRKFLKPLVGCEIDGKTVKIQASVLKTDRTPERLFKMVRGKSHSKFPASGQRRSCGSQTVSRRSSRSNLSIATEREGPDSLNMFLQFARKHKDHPAHLRVLEFLGASF